MTTPATVQDKAGAMRFYRRSGEQVSRATVKAARLAAAVPYRTGKRWGIPCAINIRIAERIENMSEEEFCREFAAFTYSKAEGEA